MVLEIMKWTEGSGNGVSKKKSWSSGSDAKDQEVFWEIRQWCER